MSIEFNRETVTSSGPGAPTLPSSDASGTHEKGSKNLGQDGADIGSQI